MKKMISMPLHKIRNCGNLKEQKALVDGKWVKVKGYPVGAAIPK